MKGECTTCLPSDPDPHCPVHGRVETAPISTLGSLLRAAREQARVSIKSIAVSLTASIEDPKRRARHTSDWIDVLRGVEEEGRQNIAPSAFPSIAAAMFLRDAPDAWYAAVNALPPDISTIANDRANWPWMRNLPALADLMDAWRAAHAAYMDHDAKKPTNSKLDDPRGLSDREIERESASFDVAFAEWHGTLCALGKVTDLADTAMRAAVIDIHDIPPAVDCARCEYDACGGVHNATCPHGTEPEDAK